MWDLRNERKETSRAISNLCQVRVQVRRALLTCWRPRRPRSFRGIGHRMRRFEDVRRRQRRSSGWFAGRVDGRGFVGDHLIHPDFTMRDQVPVVVKNTTINHTQNTKKDATDQQQQQEQQHQHVLLTKWIVEHVAPFLLFSFS